MKEYFIEVLVGAGIVLGWLLLFPPQPYKGDFNPGTSLPAKTDSLWRIAFGSCNDEDYDQSIWKPILAGRPDVWLWLGDMIYADTDDLQEMEAMYAKQKGHPDYRQLRDLARIVGVYDDHDYGWNNAGKYYPRKKESAQLALDFLDEPKESVRRRQEGIYTSYNWKAGARDIQLILLDTRYFRDEPGPDADLLGEAQWTWLEKELHRQPAPDVTLVGSSIQVLREDFWKEKWNDFPKSKQRFLEMLQKSGRDGIVLLSGDRHHGEISALKNLLPYPLYEITSSGLTHAKGVLWYWSGQERNAFRHGRPLGALNFSVIDIHFSGPLLVTAYVCDEKGNVRIRVDVPAKTPPP